MEWIIGTKPSFEIRGILPRIACSVDEIFERARRRIRTPFAIGGSALRGTTLAGQGIGVILGRALEGRERGGRMRACTGPLADRFGRRTLGAIPASADAPIRHRADRTNRREDSM
jgi:hypothetical protein